MSIFPASSADTNALAAPVDPSQPANVFQAITRAGQANKNPQREAWEFTSTYSKAHPELIGPNPIIRMSINPNSVRFSQAKRISTAKKTIGGTTYFHWSDKTGRNLDPLILSISGETGPISGLGKDFGQQQKTSIITQDGKIHPRALANAQNWARFYTLTAQPQIDPQTLERNIFTIKYRSLLFPEILFSGFYTSVLDFTDSAASPFSKVYSISFVVTGSSPDHLTLANLIGQINIDLQAKSTVVTSGTVA